MLSLILTKTSFSMQAYIGIIMLAGIVVSNAILLVDYINTLRRRDGLPRTAWQKLYQDPVQAFAPRVTLHTALHDVLKRCGQPWSSLEALLARLRLSPALLQRLPSQVSGGELQRLALIRTLLLQPALLFADEPTSRLDPVTQRDTMHCLRDELGRIGCALLLVTHDVALAGKSSARQIRL